MMRSDRLDGALEGVESDGEAFREAGFGDIEVSGALIGFELGTIVFIGAFMG